MLLGGVCRQNDGGAKTNSEVAEKPRQFLFSWVIGAAVKLSQAEHFANKAQKMGLAWHIIDLDEGETLLWHNGMTYGFSSNLVLAPASKMGVFVIANAMHLKSSGALDDRIDQLAFKIFGLLRKENKKVPDKASEPQIKQ